MKTEKNKSSLAYLVIRVAMGINLMCHGLVRLPKIAGFRSWMVEEFQSSIIPSWSVYAWASVLPILEFVIGLLLIVGLFTYRATIAGATLIAILILGSCLHEKWEWAGIQMIYILFFYVLISKVDDNSCCSIDKLIIKNKKNESDRI